MGTTEGIDEAAVTTWLATRTQISTPLRFDVVQGGRSNLTYVVTDAEDRRLVLRRPPLHGVLQSAHDMGREHRIISALSAAAVPVPDTIGYEDDAAVSGAPFYVMEHVDGVVVRDAATAAEALEPATRTAASEDLVDVLVRLHEVDVDAVGLGDLARREDYLARQLKRWRGQLHQARTRDLPVLDEVHDRLVTAIPEQGPATIVHGDYRLDNLILDPVSGQVKAVLDWELTTLGDPLADVGLLLVYWADPGDEVIPLLDAPTVVDGFLSRRQVAERYAAGSGRDLSQIEFYIAFGYWKLACILEGVFSRYSTGAYGDTDDSFKAFGDVVIALGERAAEAAGEAGR